jgi:hypothetical protein
VGRRLHGSVGREASKLRGKNLKVVCAEFSTFSWAVSERSAWYRYRKVKNPALTTQIYKNTNIT